MQDTSAGYRLSPLQERAWRLAQRDGHAGFVAALFALDPEIEPARLRAAFDRLADDFELLRARIERVPGMRDGVQYIDDAGRCRFAPDATTTADLGIDQLVALHLSDASAQAATLAAVVIVDADGARRLLLRAPATIADAASLRLLAAHLLADARGGRGSEEIAQYIDIAEWLREVLEAEDTASGRAHWTRELRADSLAPALPFERGGDDAARIARLRHAIDPDRLRDWTRRAERAGANLGAWVLAAWQRTLAVWLGDRAFSIAVEYDGRKFAELRDVVGPMARQVPLLLPAAATGIQSDAAVEAHAREVAEAMATGSRFQEYFDAETALGAHARIPVSFAFASRDEVPGRNVALDEWGAEEPFKLRLILRNGAAPRLDLDYDRGVYGDRDIACLQAQLSAALDGGTLDAGHAQDAVAGVAPLPSDTAAGLFAWHARQRPAAVALRGERGATDYATLDRAANRIALRLRRAGVGCGDRVAVCIDRNETCIAAFLGAWKLGAAYLPLDTDLPAERLREVLGEAHPALTLIEAGQEARFGALPTPSLSLPSASLFEAVCADAEAGDDVDAGVPFDPAHIAYVIFTSGSTGRPKGVAVSHRALCNYLAAIEDRLALPADAELCAFSTFAADLGYTALYGALCSGRAFRLVPRTLTLDGPGLAALLATRPIDCLKIVPSHLSALLQSGAGAELLPRRCLVMGGEAAGAELIAQLRRLSPALRILNHYGPTETTIGVTSYELAGPAYRSGLPVGHPFPGLRLHVLDPDLRPRAVGETGELYIGGLGVAQGYLARPDLTAERFLPEPATSEAGARMYRTGDLVRRWPNGAIEWLARADDQVKIRGYRVEPGEVAAAIRRIDGVADACVIAVRDRGEPWLAAYAVAPGFGEGEREAVRETLRRRLPEYMVPAAFAWMDALPLNANGKVDRAALPRPERSLARETAQVPPSTPLEIEIAAVWRELLQVESIGVRDNFFDLGGHSLLLVQLKARLDARHQRNISIVELFQNTTIEKLAAFYGAGDDAAAAAADQTRADKRASRAEQARAALMRQKQKNS